MKLFLVKGTVTDPEGHDHLGRGNLLGHVEWQVSDGPRGDRSTSGDYVDLIVALRDVDAGDNLFDVPTRLEDLEWDAQNENYGTDPLEVLVHETLTGTRDFARLRAAIALL
jgi:hypothetical protein